MNPTNIFINSQNAQPQLKKPEEIETFLHPLQVETKIITPISEHNTNFPFKVTQDEKNSNIPNNFLLLNNDKGGKNSNKNLNIIKPKFVTKTIATNENQKIKIVEEAPNLNLSLSLSGSAFQPQIIKENIENKEFRTKVNNKIYNLILDNKNNLFKLEIHQINDNIYLLKYFYENSFSLQELKLLNKFFCLFDNIPDMMKELEKWLKQNQYTVFEDTENKIAKIQIKVPILQLYENVELTLNQKTYSKENLFEILCKNVANISKDYEFRINKLEKENKFLIVNLFNLMNCMNPLNMNYPMNQRENIRNLNNLNLNQNNNLNRVYKNNNINNMNMNKNNVLIKKSHINSNMNKNIIPNMTTKNLNLNLNLNEHNKENIIYYEEQDQDQEMSNEYNSIEENNNNIFHTRKDRIRLISRKRGRGRKTSYSSNKNNSLTINKNNSNENLDSSNNNSNNNINNNNNNKNSFELNYYVLKDIKAKKINKVKGLFDIIHGPDELYMIIYKILYKYYKYKKNSNIINFESKLNFALLNLFDSSIHGDSAAVFHNLCDYKYNTISVIETISGHRFGGYTSECFESPSEYFDKKDDLSFVFSLDKMRIYDVIKGKYAISCDKNYGPYFRDDHICIVDGFLTNESGTCIKGKGFNTLKNYELNSGKKYFTVKRLQVFQIKIKRIK